MKESDLANLWTLRQGTVYLNHGSFGPSPAIVQQSRTDWTHCLESQPMDFLVREFDLLLDQTTARLGQFVGSKAHNLALVDNATVAMNLVAQAVELTAGDEILVTNHEYGAVVRTWRRKCSRNGAKVVTCRLPNPIESAAQVANPVASSITPATRLLVILL